MNSGNNKINIKIKNKNNKIVKTIKSPLPHAGHAGSGAWRAPGTLPLPLPPGRRPSRAPRHPFRTEPWCRPPSPPPPPPLPRRLRRRRPHRRWTPSDPARTRRGPSATPSSWGPPPCPGPHRSGPGPVPCPLHPRPTAPGPRIRSLPPCPGTGAGTGRSTARGACVGTPRGTLGSVVLKSARLHYRVCAEPQPLYS